MDRQFRPLNSGLSSFAEISTIVDFLNAVNAAFRPEARPGIVWLNAIYDFEEWLDPYRSKSFRAYRDKLAMLIEADENGSPVIFYDKLPTAARGPRI